MKKIILVFAAIAITTATFAQTDTTARKMSPLQEYNNPNQYMQSNPDDRSVIDGVMMYDGKIMHVKNGEMSALDHDITMNNGTKIMTDGHYTTVEGLTMMMTEGLHIDMEGNLTFIKADKDKNIYHLPDSIRKKDY